MIRPESINIALNKGAWIRNNTRKISQKHCEHMGSTYIRQQDQPAQNKHIQTDRFGKTEESSNH